MRANDHTRLAIDPAIIINIDSGSRITFLTFLAIIIYHGYLRPIGALEKIESSLDTSPSRPESEAGTSQ